MFLPSADCASEMNSRSFHMAWLWASDCATTASLTTPASMAASISDSKLALAWASLSLSEVSIRTT